MKRNIFKEYVSIRKELKLNKTSYYLKKILLPLMFSFIIFIIYFSLFTDINHKDIATVLVSTNSIVAAFLVLSLTILITQNIQERELNKKFNVKRLLINNTEVSVILVVSSIILNLFYMLISSPQLSSSNEAIVYWFNSFLNVVSFLSIFSTILVIKIAIDDLLLISSKTKN